MMDIAGIRKKARQATPPGATVSAPAVPSAPEPAVPAAAATDVAATLPAPVAETALAAGASGLDRLFSGASGLQLVTEEAYQTTLASRDRQEEDEFAQYLAFQLGPEEYALDITRISEIIKPREYTDIPRVPSFILGLISLRGVVVPVFDLRRRFSLGETQPGPAARVIVCREGEVTAGLLVDSINQVVRLAEDRIEPPPGILSGVDRNLIGGVGRFQGRMIILLNLANVLEIETA